MYLQEVKQTCIKQVLVNIFQVHTNEGTSLDPCHCCAMCIFIFFSIFNHEIWRTCHEMLYLYSLLWCSVSGCNEKDEKSDSSADGKVKKYFQSSLGEETVDYFITLNTECDCWLLWETWKVHPTWYSIYRLYIEQCLINLCRGLIVVSEAV